MDDSQQNAPEATALPTITWGDVLYTPKVLRSSEGQVGLLLNPVPREYTDLDSEDRADAWNNPAPRSDDTEDEDDADGYNPSWRVSIYVRDAVPNLLPGMSAQGAEVVIKEYDTGLRGITAALVAAGIVLPPHRFVKVGFTEAPVVRFTSWADQST